MWGFTGMLQPHEPSKSKLKAVLHVLTLPCKVVYTYIDKIVFRVVVCFSPLEIIFMQTRAATYLDLNA